jgi:hypothetical protein
MRRPTTTTQAQRTRDQGLTRVRRITWLAGLGAAAFTAVASLIAATSIPGHSQTSSSPPASVSSGGSLPNPTQQPPDAGPAQGSPPNAGSGPVIVSGGS